MRQEKQLLLEEVKGHLNRYPTFLIMNYLGFSANMANEFRKEVAAINGDVVVIRKRVLVKAAESAQVKLTLSDLPGHIGLVFASKDPLEVTKFVFKYSEDNDKKIQVIGGQFEGQMYSAEQMEKLSKLPSRDEMRAQLLATLEAPMAQTLAVMEALLTAVPHCLENKANKEG